ncbi:MAG: TolC family protein [Deltaproteobacteria bacterium]|nr:TolC family protein [Deltaproteobacteria bacterium]
MSLRSLIVFFLVIPAAHAELSLSAYLEQVRTGNKAVRGAEASSRGAGELVEMGHLLLVPTLVGEAQFVDDKKPTTNPLFLGTETSFRSYSLGVSQLTTFGLEAKLSYTLTNTVLTGVSPAFVPETSFFEAKPMLELSQSLWKNAFGASTRAGQRALEAQQLATQATESYRVRLALADAEMTYTRLALARETVTVNRESLERAVRIRDWNKRRADIHLADDVDFLQSQAALEIRRLELQGALDEELSAARAFNLAREVDSETVEALVPLNAESVTGVQAPTRAAMRDDVKAAAETDRLTEAKAEVDLQTLTPDIQIYGKMAYNGHKPAEGGAISDSFTTNFPTWVAGIKFSAPLGVPTIMKSRRGEYDVKLGSALVLEHKLLEQEHGWKDLTRKFTESKHRFELSRAIELAQKIKLDHERSRLTKGRTTVFQVLSFEQDYAAAQLGRIRAEGDVLRVVAQMKTYGQGSTL